VNEVQSFFAESGPLNQILSGYSPRPGQIDMAVKIADAIEQQTNLIAEAGTGTGKTFAYLVPALQSGKKTIISTGTKNLQDQLFNKDLPLIRKALKIPFTSALLKGRSNYVCPHRLQKALDTTFGFNKEEAAALVKIQSWAKRTKTGDITEMSEVTEQDPVWYLATSTVDNCLGQDCPVYEQCFLMKARKKAQESELVVVNHHLLCADWAIRDTGFGELLPKAEVVIVDEAHQLAEIAGNFLGMHVGGKQLADLVEDTLVEFMKDASDLPALRTACEELSKSIKDLRLAFGIELKRGEWQEIANNPLIQNGLADLAERLQTLEAELVPAAIKTKELDQCHQRAETALEQLREILDSDGRQWVRWFETHRKTFTLSRTPLNIANEFNAFMQRQQASWIFTSATLSVGKRFDHFIANLGLGNIAAEQWESPFDYPAQSLFYHPRGLPKPDDPQFIPAILDFVVPVIEASGGRAFFLFTSHRALKQAAGLLAHRIAYPLLIQGSKPKTKLLEQFKQKGNAVLLGTASFWEGVDVRGEALSCVIIDKLPFSSPGDPLLKARLNAITESGGNPFFSHQLPSAVIALKQGIGRLIRDENDRGVLMVCDPRLLKRSYGQIFLDSVPPMKRTRELADVQAFFQISPAQNKSEHEAISH
jgi:ATP-dependent DNA helicase DinG